MIAIEFLKQQLNDLIDKMLYLKKHTLNDDEIQELITQIKHIRNYLNLEEELQLKLPLL
jgi:hypothetical protein